MLTRAIVALLLSCVAACRSNSASDAPNAAVTIIRWDEVSVANAAPARSVAVDSGPPLPAALTREDFDAVVARELPALRKACGPIATKPELHKLTVDVAANGASSLKLHGSRAIPGTAFGCTVATMIGWKYPRTRDGGGFDLELKLP